MKSSAQIRLVGLTGSIAAGKSTVAEFLAEEGFATINADTVAKDLLNQAEVKDSIISMFGADCYNSDNTPNHKRIAEIIFNNEVKRHQLEALIHPLVRKKVKELARKLYPLIYDVPLLFESGGHKETDLNIMVDAPVELRFERASKRNGWSREEFMVREKNQIPAVQKRKLADLVIENDSDQETLRSRLQPLIQLLNQHK